MNLLKSIFISSYMMLIMSITGYAGWMLYQNEPPLEWVGVMLTASPPLMALSRLMMFKNTARTSAHFPILNILGAIGVVMTLWAWVDQNAEILVPALAITAWLGFIFYVFWFSKFSDRQTSSKLIAGTTLPFFTVKNINGKVLTSHQLTDKPAILIFYRGNWCPLCMAQIKELVARYKEINAFGVRVAMISPQPHSNTVDLARKHNVQFDFLTDEGNSAARGLGIDHQHGLPMGMQALGYDSDTVLPTVIITDRKGKIIWSHETDNYRIRPEPDIYLEVLRKHGVVAGA